MCWDNAVAESFWESLKRECVQGRVFATRAEARQAIFKWINWYNGTRLHSTLDDVWSRSTNVGLSSSMSSLPPRRWKQGTARVPALQVVSWG